MISYLPAVLPAGERCPHAGQTQVAVVESLRNQITGSQAQAGPGLKTNAKGELEVGLHDESLQFMPDKTLRVALVDLSNTWTNENTFDKPIVVPEIRLVSDVNKKSDFAPVSPSDAVECLANLEILAFHHSMTGGRQLGVLAQDANKTMEFFLGPNELPSVNYNNIAMLNAAVTQFLLKEIKTLREEVSTLKLKFSTSDIV